MPLSAASLAPLLLPVAIALVYYRRIRRQFGRQRYRPRRTLARVVLLALVLGALLLLALSLPVTGVRLAMAAGLAAGAGLGALALRHTRLDASDGVRWYTPNPWIGAALSLLLLGRLAWRFGHEPLSGAGAPALQAASPLTLALAACLLAYYLVNGAGLAWRMRALPA